MIAVLYNVKYGGLPSARAADVEGPIQQVDLWAGSIWSSIGRLGEAMARRQARGVVVGHRPFAYQPYSSHEK